jgi:hypothetical protein
MFPLSGLRELRAVPAASTRFRVCRESSGDAMLESSRCRCDICLIEKSLADELETGPVLLGFQKLSSADPELSRDLSPLGLVKHLHSLRYTNGSGEHSDRLLSSLRRLHSATSNPIPQTILVLTFVPVLHSTFRSIVCCYPSLAKDDIAQQAFTMLVALLQSPEWLSRRTYLAFGLAREVRRHLFAWAKHEFHFAAQLELTGEVEVAVPAAELFERDVTLRHFLGRSLERGALDAADLELLIEFKLQGDFRNGNADSASNALRQRMKRLLAKMRRRAAFRIARVPSSANVHRKSDTFLRHLPE